MQQNGRVTYLSSQAHSRPLRRIALSSSVRIAHSEPPMIWYVLVGCTGMIAYVVEPASPAVFLALSVLLVVFAGVEIRRRALIAEDDYLLQPPVLASAFLFGLAYGLSNLLFLLPDQVLLQTGIDPGVTPKMVRHVALAVMAAVAMWVGFYASVGAWCGKRLAGIIRPFVKGRGELSIPWMLGFVAVSIWARIEQVRLGVFGYSSDHDSLLQFAAVREYYQLAASLGMLSLVAVSLEYFEGRRPLLLIAMLLLLCIETAFGILSGFKSAVVMPIVVVAVGYTAIRRRLPWRFGPWVFLALVVAWLVIEPFRVATQEDAGFGARSAGSIASNLEYSASAGYVERTSVARLLVSNVARTNLTYVGAAGIDYADSGDSLPDGAPAFLTNIALAPLHAFVPRIIWETKPIQDIGLWYSHVVLGMGAFSSTAMGPITYLYLGGGAAAVVLGFFGIGILQRAWQSAAYSTDVRLLLLYILILPTLVFIDSSVNAVIIGLLRYLVLYIVLQWLLFTHAERRVVRL